MRVIFTFGAAAGAAWFAASVLLPGPALAADDLRTPLNSARPACFADPQSRYFRPLTYVSPACREQRRAERRERLGERAEWNRASRHVLARVQPRIDEYLRVRSLSPASVRNVAVGSRTVRVQLPDEVCVFAEEDADCRPLGEFQ